MTMNYDAADLTPKVIDHSGDPEWCPANGEGRHCDCHHAKGEKCHWCIQVAEENAETAEAVELDVVPGDEN